MQPHQMPGFYGKLPTQGTGLPQTPPPPKKDEEPGFFGRIAKALGSLLADDTTQPNAKDLEDKIRRLEAEKMELLHETHEQRSMLKNQIIEIKKLNIKIEGTKQEEIAPRAVSPELKESSSRAPSPIPSDDEATHKPPTPEKRPVNPLAAMMKKERGAIGASPGRPVNPVAGLFKKRAEGQTPSRRPPPFLAGIKAKGKSGTAATTGTTEPAPKEAGEADTKKILDTYSAVQLQSEKLVPKLKGLRYAIGIIEKNPDVKGARNRLSFLKQQIKSCKETQEREEMRAEELTKYKAAYEEFLASDNKILPVQRLLAERKTKTQPDGTVVEVEPAKYETLEATREVVQNWLDKKIDHELKKCISNATSNKSISEKYREESNQTLEKSCSLDLSTVDLGEELISTEQKSKSSWPVQDAISLFDELNHQSKRLQSEMDQVIKRRNTIKKEAEELNIKLPVPKQSRMRGKKTASRAAGQQSQGKASGAETLSPAAKKAGVVKEIQDKQRFINPLGPIDPIDPQKE